MQVPRQPRISHAEISRQTIRRFPPCPSCWPFEIAAGDGAVIPL